MRAARAIASLAALLVLAGCVPSVLSEGGPPRTRSESASVPATVPAPTPTDLVAARKAAGIADCPASSTKPAVPGGLPDITLDCLGGDTRLRLAGLRGPLLVNLWAQWCEPCRAEAAHLSAFARVQKEVGVLGIDYTDPQPELAIEFAQLTSMTYPHLVDEEHLLKGPLGVVGIPYTVLIDANGRIVARHPGPFDSFEQIQQWATEALG